MTKYKDDAKGIHYMRQDLVENQPDTGRPISVMDPYHFIRIDRTAPADVPSAAAKYRTLRLKALEESPHAFSSTLEVESQFPEEVWISRLQKPRQETFACVFQGQDGGGSEPEWVAQVTLRGPLVAAEFVLPPESEQPALLLPDGEEEKWQMLSLYTAPEHRGKGLGPRLCRAAFEYLDSRRKDGAASQVQVRIMVKPDNVATLRLYGSLGFVETGRCTLEEALRANGDAEFIPKEPLGPKYTTRAGIIMAMRLDGLP